jgi:hypothetical protein
LRGLLKQREAAASLQNPLLRSEALAALARNLDGLNRDYKGKSFSWRFKTVLDSSPMAVVVPSDSPQYGGVHYYVSSQDAIDNLRGMILIGVTKLPVPPRAIVGQGITAEAFRKLQPGDEFPLSVTLQEIRYELSLEGWIDVYLCRAAIVVSASDRPPAPVAWPGTGAGPAPSNPAAPGLARNLVGHLRDRGTASRVRTAEELGRICPGSPEAVRIAVPALIAALGDYDTYVRRKAAEALGQMGRLAQDAVPALKQAVYQNRDQDVVRAARNALQQIGP